MTDYENECAWCGNALDGSYVESIPAFSFLSAANRYCSAVCLTARRDELFHRAKHHAEKWPRFSAEVPPELEAMLMEAQRRSLGVNYDGWKDRPTIATRANIVRAALRLYLNKTMPVAEPSVQATASDVIDVLALGPGE